MQGLLGSNSTSYLFLLTQGPVKGKGGCLVRVRKVEAVNQSVLIDQGVTNPGEEMLQWVYLRSLVNAHFPNSNNRSSVNKKSYKCQ